MVNNKQTTTKTNGCKPKMEVDGSDDFPLEKRVIFRFQPLVFGGVDDWKIHHLHESISY